MLTQCPECQLQISDKAIMCPHCGYTLKPNSVKVVRKKQHLRLPNGFGQISELKNQKLRKRYRAMVTVGTKENGRPKCELLRPVAYFETYNEAYQALMEYHKDPCSVNQDMTLEELMNSYKEKKDKYPAWMHSGWIHMRPMYGSIVRNIKPIHIRDLIENAYKIKNGEKVEATVTGKKNIKATLNALLDFAIEYGIIQTNPSRQLGDIEELNREVQNEHITFTKEEMETLWAHSDDDIVATILIQCYTGWRPNELCSLKLANVDMENRKMIGGMKTASGKNRPVPIHSKILPLVKRFYMHAKESNLDTLICYEKSRKYKPLMYATYNNHFESVLRYYHMNMQHRPHDCRKQFVTMAKNANMDEYAIKYIVGHSISDLTEGTYTVRSFEWLQSEMEKITE